ncbi:MAG: hypothetical protein IJN29_12450, partial [Akkermansia sp.]|nr:hypothetical protein [Akkermansia sp.]
WGSNCFFMFPTGLGLRVFAFFAHTGRSRCSLHPWLLYAASPCGEAPDFASPAARCVIVPTRRMSAAEQKKINKIAF